MARLREHREGSVYYLAFRKPFYPQAPQGGLLTRPSDAVQGLRGEAVTVVVHGKERFMLSLRRGEKEYFAWASPEDITREAP